DGDAPYNGRTTSRARSPATARDCTPFVDLMASSRSDRRDVSRRDVVKWLALTCGVEPLVGACASRLKTSRSMMPERRRVLAPVRVSAARVIREVVGLRPFRPSGFVVRAEGLGDKTLIHNYGHGGGGVSLSWG